MCKGVRADGGLQAKASSDRHGGKNGAVLLSEVIGPLQILAQALTGRGLVLRSLAQLKGGVHPLHGPLSCTDGEAIFLPEAVSAYPSSALNFSAYKLTTAHQAGYVEFGTFNFNLAWAHDLFPRNFLPQSLRAIVDNGRPVSPLEGFFQLFPRKRLAVDIFQIIEGMRVDSALRREYRGLRKGMDLLLEMAFPGRPPLDTLPLTTAVLEMVMRIGIIENNNNYPWPISIYLKDLLQILKPLSLPGVTVRDSAKATVIIYRWLSALPNIRIDHLSAVHSGTVDRVVNKSVVESEAVDFAPRIYPGEEPYESPRPLAYRGQLRPELLNRKMRVEVVQSLLQKVEAGGALPAEELRAILERGLESSVRDSGGDGGGPQGFLPAGLPEGGQANGPLRQGRQFVAQQEGAGKEPLPAEPAEEACEGSYFYDEWDHRIRNYRPRWCRLEEQSLEVGTGEFVARTLAEYAVLIAEVRRQFQMLKPERFKRIPQLERGEEIDLNAAIEAMIDRRAGLPPSEKIYIEKNRKERDFATIFLLDMSASTDERLKKKGEVSSISADKKVIDVEKEALIIMAEALREIGDEYAIYGFSGYGRKEVDFFLIKDFMEEYGEKVRGRIEKIRPQRSTRMGAAIRHALSKIAGRNARIKNIILISDGYPQDFDYGEVRGSREYALQDTMTALGEAVRRNVHTFCITVDRAGHDYLRQMCQPSRYLVIRETSALPRELPKIYRRLTT